MRKLNSLSSVHDGIVVSRKIVNDSNLQKQLNESHVIYLQTILASNSINIQNYATIELYFLQRVLIINFKAELPSVKKQIFVEHIPFSWL